MTVRKAVVAIAATLALLGAGAAASAAATSTTHPIASVPATHVYG